MFIDSHCHLDYFKTDEAIEAVIARARANQICCMLSISVTPRKHNDILKIIERHAEIYASIGLHPCHVADEPDVSAAQLIEIAQNHDKIIAFGESGLDYFRKPYDMARQKQNFLAHIHAAQQENLPLIVHNRNADDDLIDILEQEFAKKPFPCIMHCFAASESVMRRAVAMGFYISFSGILTYKSATDLRAIAKNVPENLLLIETDAPYLAPEPMRGQKNEPAFIGHTAKILADVRDVSLEHIANVTRDNFLNLMTKIKPAMVENLAKKNDS